MSYSEGINALYRLPIICDGNLMFLGCTGLSSLDDRSFGPSASTSLMSLAAVFDFFPPATREKLLFRFDML